MTKDTESSKYGTPNIEPGTDPGLDAAKGAGTQASIHKESNERVRAQTNDQTMINLFIKRIRMGVDSNFDGSDMSLEQLKDYWNKNKPESEL